MYMRVLAFTVSLLLTCSVAVETQPQYAFISLGLRQALKQGGGNLVGQLCSPLESILVSSLQCGRYLLVVMYSHYPSPGGLPPLISTPRLVTSCSSRSESTGGRQLWL